ncbi:MAG: AAA-like domain protein [Candidatus Methanofastidiosum methylothiophilum]|uniref:AAA-like domain protein n=1 Tax=Candidatus Methanofastidiosum methylothiophilum TaxID=1705564 RepID=A0A150IM07_9EURY|nr:MAG: AAA-like domain protein [Candidatus Methanofastidiosum methylthiophilus]KYC48289.1 MAG: AAA-like domain protein [Candidatus Methanofastidiosum methylthiophilus]KYC50958.1 MAG: AAA-like domain protein [Candidatus Methanofastidiosum methylthiophilus]
MIDIEEKLELLSDEEGAYVGRKRSTFEKYKSKAALYIGKVNETSRQWQNYFNKRVLLDSISPHAIFICGMRGSGKSYTLGVIVEEMAMKNDGVGILIIDPMGIFWSMKQKNKTASEGEMLERWGLKPTGIKNVRVFIPKGYVHKAPKETWDDVFKIKPSELRVEDWCLTFDIERFDTMGLLIERVIEKTKTGYTTIDEKHVPGLGDDYDIEDLIKTIENEESISSREGGFKENTRRALNARLTGAIQWGIFDKKGTKLNDLSKRGQVSVIDVSFLEDNVRALVVGLLSRNILNTRKVISRQEAMGDINIIGNVPVTWLMIDEAHILVPRGGKATAATDSLIEYVRQGRQPGCSIVLATQQPSAIDSRILSQVDLLICHKLVYQDDIKAVLQRMPSEIPNKLSDFRFIRSLPIGSAIIGDKEESTSRAFLISVRPRISQHEGRERQPMLEIDPELMKTNVKNLILEKYRQKRPLAEMEEVVNIANQEYKLDFSFEDIIEELRIDGEFDVKEEVKPKPEPKPVVLDIPMLDEEEDSLEEVELIDDYEADYEEIETPSFKAIKVAPVISSEIGYDEIKEIAIKNKKKIYFRSEEIKEISPIYYPLSMVFLDYMPKKGSYKSMSCFFDGITGELVIWDGKISRTVGFSEIYKLKSDEKWFLDYLIDRENPTLSDIKKETGLTPRKTHSLISNLEARGLIETKQNGSNISVRPKLKFKLVRGFEDKKLKKLEVTLKSKEISGRVIESLISKNDVSRGIETLGNAKIWRTEEVYLPYWLVVYKNSKGKERREVFDAFKGKKDDAVKDIVLMRL